MSSKKTYNIYGTEYTCYFYNNGYDQGVTVFRETDRDMLFKFDESITMEEAVFLLKGYELALSPQNR
tara:strand:- start:89 stop:289 length:201 start_codon:yes stop_codon:yes gene_type:complete